MTKRRWWKVLLVAIMLLNLGVITAFAQMQQYTKTEEKSVLLPLWNETAKDIKNNFLRGSIISTGIAEIGNEGDGNISIYAQTLAHVECEEIRHKVYLDRWDEVKEYWYTVDTYDFTETKADHPDEKFTSLTSHFSVLKQPTGYYYRLRAVHTATLNGRMEVLSSRTDGVFITKN